MLDINTIDVNQAISDASLVEIPSLRKGFLPVKIIWDHQQRSFTEFIKNLKLL